MKPEDKELLLKDLCARLPYEPVIEYVVKGITGNAHMTCKLDVLHIDELLKDSEDSEVKPHLRPMSSQTSEEREELNNILQYQYYSDDSCMCEATDWLNAHHFDYRGLIDKGLAIEVTELESPFKVGDKVVINCREEFATAYNGKEGTIVNIFDLEKNHWGNIVVVLDNGMRNTFYASELIKK